MPKVRLSPYRSFITYPLISSLNLDVNFDGKTFFPLFLISSHTERCFYLSALEIIEDGSPGQEKKSISMFHIFNTWPRENEYH